MGLLEAHLAQLILTDVHDVAGCGIEAESPVTVDVGDAQRPFPVEDIGMPVGHRHHQFVQAHGFTPRNSSGWV